MRAAARVAGLAVWAVLITSCVRVGGGRGNGITETLQARGVVLLFFGPGVGAARPGSVLFSSALASGRRRTSGHPWASGAASPSRRHPAGTPSPPTLSQMERAG